MQLTFIVGMILGWSATIIGLVATYYLFRAAKNLTGGALGTAFNKLAIGILLLVFSAQFMGITMGNFRMYGDWITFISTGSDLLGVIFLLAGARGIIKSTGE